MTSWFQDFSILWILMSAAVILAGLWDKPDGETNGGDSAGNRTSTRDPEGLPPGDQRGFAITILDGPLITFPRGKNLMKGLEEQDIHVPGSCGGRGECGMCRVRVFSSGNPGRTVDRGTPVEEALLGPREIVEGHRLACQCVPVGDAFVELPPGVAAAHASVVKVERVHNVGGGFRLIDLDLPEIPGNMQMIAPWYMVGLPDLSPRILKAYTISRGREILVRRVPGGLVSGYLHELRPGDLISIQGPYGGIDRNALGNRMVIVSGGSGFAAARAVMASIGSAPEIYGSISYRLCAGFRTLKELPPDSLAWGAFDPVQCMGIEIALSDAPPPDQGYGNKIIEPEDFNGRISIRCGLAHELLADAIADPRIAGEDLKDIEMVTVFACGPAGMLAEVKAKARGMGVRSEKIILDDFGNRA